MRFAAALLLPLVVAEAHAGTAQLDAELGVAELRGGQWCLASGAGGLATGTALTLYEPYAGLKAAARVAGAADDQCGELKSRFIWPRQPDAPVHLYRLQPTDARSAEQLAGAGALFAILGPPERASGRGIDLDGDGTPERFRICTSDEGLNFVVESAEQVLWHAYYHLGLDVEPDCPDRIYAE
jgi:hypothetical protein